MLRKDILLLLVIILGLTINSCTPQNEPGLPNIIFILADDLGYGDVACLNENGKIPTPTLDEMAAEGMLFTDAHTSSAVCTPTRYGIITGRYNWRSRLKMGVLSGYSTALIPQERTTAAELLKEQGYVTAFIGKWHLGWDWDTLSPDPELQRDNLDARLAINYEAPVKNGPSTHGFDYSFGFCSSLDMPPYVYVENDMPTMVPVKETVSADEKGFWRRGPTADDFNHASVLQDVTDKAVGFIGQQAGSGSPFFLYFAHPLPLGLCPSASPLIIPIAFDPSPATLSPLVLTRSVTNCPKPIRYTGEVAVSFSMAWVHHWNRFIFPSLRLPFFMQHDGHWFNHHQAPFGHVE